MVRVRCSDRLARALGAKLEHEMSPAERIRPVILIGSGFGASLWPIDPELARELASRRST